MSDHEPKDIISLLDLKRHPEGGFFTETYRDASTTPDGRSRSTLIYFLLTAEEVSHLHRIDSAESWHYYGGDTLEVIELDEKGPCITAVGMNLAAGERPQHVVARDRWFGARVKSGGSWCLVGCAVAPGFSFDTFELGRREQLLQEFPDCRDIILSLTTGD